MPRLGKKDKEEWAYFINEIGRRQYNNQCRQCVQECKQSYRAVIVCCQKYKSKRAVTKPSASEREIHPSHKSDDLYSVYFALRDRGSFA